MPFLIITPWMLRKLTSTSRWSSSQQFYHNISKLAIIYGLFLFQAPIVPHHHQQVRHPSPRRLSHVSSNCSDDSPGRHIQRWTPNVTFVPTKLLQRATDLSMMHTCSNTTSHLSPLCQFTGLRVRHFILCSIIVAAIMYSSFWQLFARLLIPSFVPSYRSRFLLYPRLKRLCRSVVFRDVCCSNETGQVGLRPEDLRRCRLAWVPETGGWLLLQREFIVIVKHHPSCSLTLCLLVLIADAIMQPNPA